MRRFAALLLVALLLSACSPPEEPPVREPYAHFTAQTVTETEGDTILYRGQINLPQIRFSDAFLASFPTQAERFNAWLEEYALTLLTCPVDTDLLRSKLESSPDSFVPYERSVTAEVTWLDEHCVSILFSIADMGGGMGTVTGTRGFTAYPLSPLAHELFLALGIDKKDDDVLIAAAYADDMAARPHLYWDPDAELREEWVDTTAYCLTERGILIWLPDDTISKGGAPILELTEADVIRLIGKGEMLHLKPPSVDETAYAS